MPLTDVFPGRHFYIILRPEDASGLIVDRYGINTTDTEPNDHYLV